MTIFNESCIDVNETDAKSITNMQS